MLRNKFWLSAALFWFLTCPAKAQTSNQNSLDIALIKAAAQGEDVKALLEKGANPKAFGSRALVAAIKNGYPKVVWALLKAGAPISFAALQWALRNWKPTAKTPQIAEVLLDGGADVNQIGPWERESWQLEGYDHEKGLTTLLIIAIKLSNRAETKNGELIKMLIAKGADVNLASPNGVTALDTAMASNQLDLALILLKNGAKIGKYGPRLLKDAMGYDGGPLVDELKKRGALPAKMSFSQFNFPVSTDAVKAILEAGGNPNEASKDGWTPLHAAAISSAVESMQLLLDAGANIEAKADYWNNDRTEVILGGITPVFYAGDLKSLEFLLQHGANPNAVETHHGFSLLMAMIYNHHSPQAVALLLKYGAKIDAQDSEGQTALHLAAINNKLDVVKVLLATNSTSAFVDKRDKEGRTALLRAAEPLPDPNYNIRENSNYFPIVPALTEAGADIRAIDKTGATVLHESARDFSDGTRKIQYFREKGFRTVDVPNNNGETPLFRACEVGNVQTAHLLLTLGANPDAPTKKGSSPREIASQPSQIKFSKLNLMRDKKVIEMVGKAINDATTKRRKQILAFMNKIPKAVKP